jgi:hypothetical protein
MFWRFPENRFRILFARFKSDESSYPIEIIQGRNLRPFLLKVAPNRFFKKENKHSGSIYEEALQHTPLSCEDIGCVAHH